MLSNLISLILPDYCCSCDEIGDILCVSCKYDIENEHTETCVMCGAPTQYGHCSHCRLPYSRAWAVGEHRDSLERLVAVSKFGPSRRGCDAQAALLDSVLPQLPADTIIAPVPTIARHVRQRGFGHAERIARTLASRRSVRSEDLVVRTAQFVQHGANRKMRKQQAEQSYALKAPLHDDATYLLVDDVFTTGYTMQAVANLFAESGAHDVWVAVTSRQPLDVKV